MKAKVILSNKEALTVIAELRKHGIQTKVQKVAKGYLVAAADEKELLEENAMEMADQQIKDAVKETTLPEEKSPGTEKELNEQKSINADDEEPKLEMKADEKVDNFLGDIKEQADEADKAQEEDACDMKDMQEQAADAMEDALEEKAEDELKEQLSEDELMDEKEALATLAFLSKNKIGASIKPFGRKMYAISIASEDIEKYEQIMAAEIKIEEMDQKSEEKADDEEKIEEKK